MIATLGLRGKADLDARDSWAGVLSAVAFAMRAIVHTTMRATPMQLVFGRDAIFKVRFQARLEVHQGTSSKDDYTE
jgi:hypothetical protein